MSSNPTTETQAPASARLTVIVLCFGGMSAALMQTLVIPIQTELPRLLHTSPANASWVVTATLLGGAVAMPIAGRLADMFGKQRVLLGSSILLVLGSLICALSDSLLPMLSGRVLQGLAMGFIPVGISLMREVTPPAMTNTAIASMSATLGVGGAIGLPLSAWVAEDFNWHALFWMSVGLASLMVLSVAFLVPHVHDAHGGRFDIVGALGLAVGLLGTLIAISKGNEWGWGHARTLGLLAGGVVVLVAVGLLRAAHQGPAVRPPGHRAATGAAHQPRGRRRRFRHDGAGDRRTPAAADPQGHRLRARADDAAGRALDGAGRSDDARVRPGVQPADDPHRAQADADDRRRRARDRLPRRA